WALELTEDKRDAFVTLHHVLVTVCRLMAPFAPYISEEIFRNLTNEKSVHLTDYPQSDAKLINSQLESEMQAVVDVVTLGRVARNNAQIKVRQTLGDLYLPENVRSLVERMEALIKEEINIKAIHYVKEEDDMVHYEIKPNFKVLGPKAGKLVKKIASELAQADANAIRATILDGGTHSIEIDGQTVELIDEDLLFSIQKREGYTFESNRTMYVALDTHLSPELVQEGLAREMVNKIQFSRREMGLDIMDRIIVTCAGPDEICEALKSYSQYIKDETLTDDILSVSTPAEKMSELDINGHLVHIRIEKSN
ncbi:MAG: DUF5915 domain-containing protein, partial [Candidatus Cloacimonetes bacterium]|nr:DUF5915 domain-containing protein [Candidatus Cloacimonadota bacterium]